MILIWRGWGLLAVVALFPLLASCGGLITVEPKWVFGLAASASLLLAGAVCLACGTRWNRHGTEHSFYFVPLQAWGWLYLGAVGVLAAFALGGGVFRTVQPPPGGLDPARPHPALVAVGGGVALVVVVATAWAALRWARPRTDGPPADADDLGP